jgi:hypothetical protein
MRSIERLNGERKLPLKQNQDIQINTNMAQNGQQNINQFDKAGNYIERTRRKLRI